jgi:hypothetical protein
LLDHGEQLHGAFSTLNIADWHNDASACSLSRVLEPETLATYCLSTKAKEGILRRAQRRGKRLPTLLAQALSESSTTPATATNYQP